MALRQGWSLVFYDCSGQHHIRNGSFSLRLKLDYELNNSSGILSVLSQTGYLDRNMVAWQMKFSGPHFPQDLILTAVGWYLRSNLSYRDVEELMAERGIVVDQSTINEVGISWRWDETYIKVHDQWKCLSRAVDKDGNSVDFLLTAKPDTKAGLVF